MGRTSMAVALAAVVIAAPVHGQGMETVTPTGSVPADLQITCLPPAAPDRSGRCRVEVAEAESTQVAHLALRIESAGRPVEGARVTFFATGGSLAPGTATTGSDGIVRAAWIRSGGAAPVAVIAHVKGAGTEALRSVLIFPERSRQRELILEGEEGVHQAGFESSPLPHPRVRGVVASSRRSGHSGRRAGFARPGRP